MAQAAKAHTLAASEGALWDAGPDTLSKTSLLLGLVWEGTGDAGAHRPPEAAVDGQWAGVHRSRGMAAFPGQLGRPRPELHDPGESG